MKQKAKQLRFYVNQALKFAFLACLLLFLGVSSVQQTHNRQLAWAQDNFLVLLTMSIDPQGTVGALRSNVGQRIEDYRLSLQRWAQLPYNVLVIESSGYGNPFPDILNKAKNLQYISKKLPHIPSRGKGYGEANILLYAIDNYILSNNLYIMKITGRYAPAGDLSEILTVLQNEKPDILYRPKRSEWFVAKRDFYQQLAQRCLTVCGDGAGLISFETNLTQLSSAENGRQYKAPILVIKTRNGRNGVETSI